jgi:hypothetical protein
MRLVVSFIAIILLLFSFDFIYSPYSLSYGFKIIIWRNCDRICGFAVRGVKVREEDAVNAAIRG